MFRISRFLWIVLGTATLFSACSLFDTGVAEVEAEVAEFRELIRNGAIAQIYEQSSKAFKRSSTQHQLEGFLSPLRRTIGEETRLLVNWKAGVDRTHGYIITLTYQATTANSLPNEEFVYVKEEGKYKLLNYRIW